MSFARQVYIAAVLAGWSALAGWVVCEFVVLRLSAGAAWEAVPSAGVVGAAIGVGVGAAAGLAGGSWRRTTARAGVGLLGGLVGGLLGGLAGQGLYRAGLPQWLGWTVIGGLIGMTDGVFGRDARRVRNGLIGGLLGGLAGGLLFRALAGALGGGTGMTARAAGFVSIGVAIGALVGLVQVLLRNAWVTVIDGAGVGRQLVLAGAATPLGASSAAALVIAGEGVEEDHAALVRTGAGYAVRDHDSLTGTTVNGRPVVGTMALADGDVIRIGSTFLRFNTAVKGVEPRPLPRPAPPFVVEGVPIPKPAPPPAPRVVAPPKPVAPPPAPSKPVFTCEVCGTGFDKRMSVCPKCGAMS